MHDVRLGIEIVNAGRAVARFVLADRVAARPFSVGREGQVPLPGADVLPIHGVLHVRGGRLWVRSTSLDAPIRIGRSFVPIEPVEIPLESVLHLGARTSVRTFAVAAARAQLGSRLAADWFRTSWMVRGAAGALPFLACLLMARSSRGANDSRPPPQVTASAPASPAAAAPAEPPPPEPSVAPPPSSPLTVDERRERKRAVDLSLGGDYASALPIYVALATAHPDNRELLAAVKIVGSKLGQYR